MSNFAIHAEGIGKRYPIGTNEARYKSLRDSITRTALAPLRLLRRNTRGQEKSAPSHIWALKDITFDVSHGEVLGIIGHNGSGKSTLLKILSRITSPTEGEIRLHGRVGSLLEVGTGFHHELTGRENIFLNGAILGMKGTEIQRKFDEIVDFAEVSQFIDTQVKYYSTGMYLRLAFAVAAHLETEILLVDEVLAVGDIAFQKKCIGKMSEVASAGRTVIFISHNMAAITQLCNRIIWLDRGKIRATGEPDQLTADYAHTQFKFESIDLANIPRTGTGKARFTSVRTLDENLRGCNVFSMGDSLTVEMKIESQSIKRLNLSVIIEDAFGKHILHAVNQDDGFEPFAEDNNFQLRVTFPNLMLYPGDYYLTLICEYEREIYDNLQSAIPFRVEQSSVSGRLTVMRPGKAVYFSPTRWNNF